MLLSCAFIIMGCLDYHSYSQFHLLFMILVLFFVFFRTEGRVSLCISSVRGSRRNRHSSSWNLIAANLRCKISQRYCATRKMKFNDRHLIEELETWPSLNKSNQVTTINMQKFSFKATLFPGTTDHVLPVLALLLSLRNEPKMYRLAST